MIHLIVCQKNSTQTMSAKTPGRQLSGASSATYLPPATPSLSDNPIPVCSVHSRLADSIGPGRSTAANEDLIKTANEQVPIRLKALACCQRHESLSNVRDASDDIKQGWGFRVDDLLKSVHIWYTVLPSTDLLKEIS